MPYQPPFGRGREQQINLDEREFELEERKRIAEFEHQKRMEELGLNADGSPIAPEWADLGSVVDEEGNLLSDFELEAQQLDPTTIAGFDKLRDFATGTGPSEYAMAAKEKLGLEEANQREAAIRQGQSATAQAQSQLAMRGGLTSGARERIAAGGARNILDARQRVSNQAMLGRADIDMQDAATRQDALSKFVGFGAELGQFNLGQKSDADRFNIQTQLGEVSARRGFELDKYKEEVNKYAAEKKADAQRAACFAAGTPIQLANGDVKNIEDIVIGDEVEAGGKVYAIYQQGADAFDMYNYKGVFVTHEHAVYEDGKWTRVGQSRQAISSAKQVDVVYDFSTVNHLIMANGVLFADYEESDDADASYDKRLEDLEKQRVRNVAVC